MTAPAPGSEWFCQNCHANPIKAPGESLCVSCAEALDEPESDAHAEALAAAKDALGQSQRALNQGGPQSAIAAALQGLLILGIEAAERPTDLGMDFGGFTLPEAPEPERGPKAWGQ